MSLRPISKAHPEAEQRSGRLKGLGEMLAALRPGNRRGAEASQDSVTESATDSAPASNAAEAQDPEEDSSEVMAPENPEQLQQFLIGTVAEICGLQPSEVSTEEDGSISLSCDHCLIFVQRSGGDTAILVSAYLFKDLKTTPEALELLNLLNGDCLYGRFYLEDEVLIYEDGFAISRLTRGDLIEIFDLFDAIAADFMGKIQERIGGTPIIAMEREDEIEV